MKTIINTHNVCKKIYESSPVGYISLLRLADINDVKTAINVHLKKQNIYLSINEVSCNLVEDTIMELYTNNDLYVVEMTLS
jgi:hypothetical protein